MRKILCLLLLTAVFSLFFTGCGAMGAREPIDPAAFQAVVEAAGFEVVDVFEACENDCEPESLCEICESWYGIVHQVFVARGERYDFEFFEFIGTGDAGVQFNRARDQIESWRGSVSSHSSVSMSNHSRFELTSEGRYSQVYRVDNVVIFVTADAEHRDAIREIMSQF